MNELTVSHLSKKFGEKQILSDFSFSVPLGSVTCLMGASGCGKTTLLRILLGLEKADGGEIQGLPPRVVCMFQEDRLCEAFSVCTNIRMVAPHMKKEEIQAHLHEVGLTNEGARAVGKLSGGMKRRVALVRAVCTDCDMLLLDEPFKGLDEASAICAAKYLQKHQNGRTLLLVTHEKDDADRLYAPVIHIPHLQDESEK